jgi:hypothetical protein
MEQGDKQRKAAFDAAVLMEGYAQQRREIKATRLPWKQQCHVCLLLNIRAQG